MRSLKIMSFRKRGEVIGTPNSSRVPALGRIPSPGISTPATLARGGPSISKDSEGLKEKSNTTVRSSLITSHPTISTGTADLDKLLAHHGLPLGNSLLIEESGTTDFASILLRVFASQGISQNRSENILNCHVIVIGMTQEWATELPGLYKGSSKDKKQALIKEKESLISVSSLSQQSAREQELKIAWRYGLNKKVDSNDENTIAVHENYSHQFDITERLRPVPDYNEISFVALNDYLLMIKQIKSIILNQLKNKSKIIRVIIPSLLTPSVYAPEFCQSTFVIPFFHSLRVLLKQYCNNVSLIVSLPLDLYPRTSSLVATLETLADSIIHLEPFNQKLVELMEKAYKNQPSKIQHGYVNILKLPVLSERGLMIIKNHEYAFKNGRKKFEIEAWGIPVEVDEAEPQATTKDVDF